MYTTVELLIINSHRSIKSLGTDQYKHIIRISDPSHFIRRRVKISWIMIHLKMHKNYKKGQLNTKSTQKVI